MRPTATCEHISSSRYIQDLSFHSWKLLLTMERRGRLQITPAVKHWNCFPHNGTVPHTVTLSSSTSNSGQVPFERGCFNHIQNFSVERTKRTDRALRCERQGGPFGLQALQTLDSTKQNSLQYPKISHSFIFPNKIHSCLFFFIMHLS